MADSTITKNAFASALKQLVIDKDFEKISIGDICALCNMNRKSFYYHFHDKYELVIWIFKNEFSQVFSKGCAINVWDTLSILCKYFYDNKAFYKKILQIHGQNSFNEYFANLCSTTLKERLKGYLDGITITEMNVKTYTDFFVFCIYSWLTKADSRDDIAFVKDIRNSVVFGIELARIFSERQMQTSEDSEKSLIISSISKQ